MTYKVAVLPGDGIGPEVMDAAVSIMLYAGEHYGVEFELTSKLIGGCSYDKYGAPLTEDTLQACYESDVILFGAVGGQKWEPLLHDRRPEAALLKLRESLELFSNLRPVRAYSPLVDASPLRPDVFAGTDAMVVRELTGGVYFGIPRGFDEYRGWNTLAYTRPEVERIARVAFELASKRRSHVTSVHKANVLESSQFWKKVVHDVHADYPQVTLTDMYVDNAAMQLVRDPRQFDVILTQNMFGDILSDIGATLTGSLGMLPSASIGEKYALYEPVHGSASALAGQNKANPIAMIGSVAMMFAYSFNMQEAAAMLDQAIHRTLADGFRTADIATPGSTVVSTREMRDHIVENLRHLFDEPILAPTAV